MKLRSKHFYITSRLHHHPVLYVPRNNWVDIVKFWVSPYQKERTKDGLDDTVWFDNSGQYREVNE